MHVATLFAILLFSLPANAQMYTREEINRAVSQAGGVEQFLAVLAENGAKSSGRMIDSQTELLSVQAVGKAIVFYNRHTNWSKSDIADTKLLRAAIARRNAPSVCTAPVASVLIHEYGAQYKYIIYSAKREYLLEYSFDRRTCKTDFAW